MINELQMTTAAAVPFVRSASASAASSSAPAAAQPVSSAARNTNQPPGTAELNQAIEFEERGDLLAAQRMYEAALGSLMASMKAEKNAEKKDTLKEIMCADLRACWRFQR